MLFFQDHDSSSSIITLKSSNTLLFVDGNSIKTGGVETLNQDLFQYTKTHNFDMHRCSLVDLPKFLRQIANSESISIVFDQSMTWRRLFLLINAKLKINYIFPSSKKISWFIREHHYSEGYLRQSHVKSRRLSFLLKIAYRLFDHVIFVSEAQQKWAYSQQLITPESDYSFIRHTPCLNLLVPVAQQLSKPKTNSECVFGVFGRLCKQKGIAELAQKWPMVTSHLKCSLLVGGYGEQEDVINTLCNNHANMNFLGKVYDSANFLAQLDYLIIPSLWEPFGLVATEAKAMGKPIIVTDTDGLPEQAEQCGWCFSPDNLDSLGAALQHAMRVFETKNAYSELSSKCRSSYHRQKKAYPDNLLALLCSNNMLQKS